MSSATNTLVTQFPGALRFSNEPVRICMDTNIPDSTEPYLTSNELAARFALKERTVRDWHARYPDFPALKMPGTIRIRVSDFLAWLEQFKRVRRYKIASGEQELGTGQIETMEAE
jgi:hypothetical protein